MADIASLAEAIEHLKIEVQSTGGQQIVFLDSLSVNMEDLVSTSSLMLAELIAIKDALAPDNAFERVQQKEREREADISGQNVTPDQQAIKPVKSGMSGKGMLMGAALIGGIGALLATFSGLLDFDAEALKQKVKTLLSLKDEVADGSLLKLLAEGGVLIAVLGGIGLALGAFGIGAAVAGGGMAFADWAGGGNWSQAIVDHVVTLLSIKDQLGGNLEMLKDGFAFTLAMTGVGLGLAAFGAGAFVGGAGLGFSDWAGGDNWSQKIKDHVVTLLSIKDELGGNWDMLKASGAFALAMGGVGAGLAAIGIGMAVAGATLTLADWMAGDWSQKIKDHVIILLSISDALGGAKAFIGEAATFALAMAGIGLGLAAFSAGQAAAAVAKFISADDWTQTIKDNVKNLLSITSEGYDQKKADEFSSVMGTISAGLLKFSGGNLVSSLAGAASGILNFLSGKESPIEEMMNIANKADKLEKGANALDRIAGALSKISGLNFNGSDLNIADMAEDLLKSIPAIETAINGGTVGEGWISSGTKIKGLASGDIKFDEAAKNITLLRESLGLAPVVQAAPTADVSSAVVPPAQQPVINTVTTVAAPTTMNSSSNTNISPRNQQQKAWQEDLVY
jgi:hypothetical protein